MPPFPELNADDQRALILLLPFLIAGAGLLIQRPNTRMLAGIFLASLWNFVMLFPVNLLAVHMEWWRFHSDRHLLLQLPFDVLLGWAVWWGAALFLLFKGRYLFLAVMAALWIDLLVMPHIAPLVTLGEERPFLSEGREPA